MWMQWGVLQGAADAKPRASRICKSFTSEAAMRPCELVVRRIQTTSLKNKHFEYGKDATKKRVPERVPESPKLT